MAFKITMNKIYLTRGDTARFSITLEDAKSYTFTELDKVYFIVTKCNTVLDIDSLDTNPDCLFYKIGTSVVLESTDTKDLSEGTYYYHVRVLLSISGDLNTIIEPTEFIISPRRCSS